MSLRLPSALDLGIRRPLPALDNRNGEEQGSVGTKAQMTMRLWPVIVAVGLAAGVGVGQEVVDSVDIGSWGQDALTYNSRAGVIYGTSWNGEKVFAIACSTNTLVADIHVKYPQDIAYDPIDNKAFVSYSYHDEDSVLVLDGYTHARLRAFAVPGVWTLLYDSVSNRIHANCFDEDEAAAIAISSSGVPYVAGGTVGSDATADWVTVRHSPATSDAEEPVHWRSLLPGAFA